MADEVTIEVDTTNAEIAASDAEHAAVDAQVAAAAAMGATVAQGQLIGQVMEHAREDARESAADAAEAAEESTAAAETAIAVNAITAEMYQEMMRRIEALETKDAEREAIQASSSPEEAVTLIPPEGDQGQEEQNASTPAEEGQAAVAASPRRGHRGRRR